MLYYIKHRIIIQERQWLYKAFLYLFIFLMPIYLLTGCQPNNQKSITATGFYLDTIITITLYETDEESLLQKGFELCRQYDAQLSKTNQHSEIYKLNHSQGQPVFVSDETLYLIKKGMEFGNKSNGMFDISIGAVSRLWNFKDNSPEIPDENTLKQAVEHTDYHQIQINGNEVTIPEHMELDLGGIAKGYIGDKLKEFYKKQGVTSALLNLGGNILCIGTPPDRDEFHIGIQKPFSDGESITDIYITDQCIVTSGIYERYFEKDGTIYHHILNPSTGYPVQTDLYSVTIIGDNSMIADVLSTTCLMLGSSKGQKLVQTYDDIQAIFITNEYKIIRIP